MLESSGAGCALCGGGGDGEVCPESWRPRARCAPLRLAASRPVRAAQPRRKRGAGMALELLLTLLRMSDRTEVSTQILPPWQRAHSFSLLPSSAFSDDAPSPIPPPPSPPYRAHAVGFCSTAPGDTGMLQRWKRVSEERRANTEALSRSFLCALLHPDTAPSGRAQDSPC